MSTVNIAQRVTLRTILKEEVYRPMPLETEYEVADGVLVELPPPTVALIERFDREREKLTTKDEASGEIVEIDPHFNMKMVKVLVPDAEFEPHEAYPPVCSRFIEDFFYTATPKSRPLAACSMPFEPSGSRKSASDRPGGPSAAAAVSNGRVG